MDQLNYIMKTISKEDYVSENLNWFYKMYNNFWFRASGWVLFTVLWWKFDYSVVAYVGYLVHFSLDVLAGLKTKKLEKYWEDNYLKY